MSNQQKAADKETLQRLYHDEGMSGIEIADELDISSSHAYRLMDQHDVERNKSMHDPTYPTYFATDEQGYERWRPCIDGVMKTVTVHRLVAVAEHGVDAVSNAHVHHKNRIPWDNRPSNLEPLAPEEHDRVHNGGGQHRDRVKFKRTVESSDSYDEVAERLNCAVPTARQWAERHDITPEFADRSYRHKETYTSVYDECDGNLDQMVDVWPVTKGTVREWGQKHGLLESNTRSEYPWRDEERLRQRYVVAEDSLQTIADDWDTSPSTISNWVNRHGFDTRSSPSDRSPSLQALPSSCTWSHIDVMATLYHRYEYTTKDVGRAVGVSQSRVSQLFNKHDVDTRGRGGIPTPRKLPR